MDYVSNDRTDHVDDLRLGRLAVDGDVDHLPAVCGLGELLKGICQYPIKYRSHTAIPTSMFSATTCGVCKHNSAVPERYFTHKVVVTVVSTARTGADGWVVPGKPLVRVSLTLVVDMDLPGGRVPRNVVVVRSGRGRGERGTDEGQRNSSRGGAHFVDDARAEDACDECRLLRFVQRL